MPRPFIIFPHSSHSLSVRTLFGEMELNPSSHENRCEIHAWLLLFKFFRVHILLVIYGFIEQRRFHFAPFLSFTINATEIDWIVCARHTNGPLMIFLNLIEIRQEINMHHHFHPSIHPLAIVGFECTAQLPLLSPTDQQQHRVPLQN